MRTIKNRLKTFRSLDRIGGGLDWPVRGDRERSWNWSPASKCGRPDRDSGVGQRDSGQTSMDDPQGKVLHRVRWIQRNLLI